MRYLIQLAYNGAAFHGWQYQPNAPSVQQTLSDALSILCRDKVEVTGAGRTDTGVHASFYVAHFDYPGPLPETDRFLLQLNGILSNDLHVSQIFPVDADYHARFSALSRTYRYFLSRQKELFRRDFVHFCPYNLDVDLMNQGASILRNSSDFTSFSKLHTDVKTNICRVSEARWVEESDLLVFTVTADRFLRNMVRALVGTLIDLGRNKISLADLHELIEARNRSKAGASVPAKALFLTDIVYPEPVNRQLIRSEHPFLP